MNEIRLPRRALQRDDSAGQRYLAKIWCMDEFHRAAGGLAQICRDAIDEQVFGGNAPHDSNVLSEHWPTAEGAAFTGEYRGQKYLIAVLPENASPDPDRALFTDPDYGVLDG